MTNTYVVHTKQGRVKGQKKNSKSFSKREYYAFLGVPYAKPPFGNLRFKDPQPPEAWCGVLDCLEDPPVCPQKQILLNHFVGEEDCLRLNIYTPKLPNEDSSPIPVMVWLHGGGFTFGSGNSDFYGPDYLIEQDIVLVNVNYRLGVLGFLTFETKDVPGNAGLKDQTMALRWVQENISAFGGDPKNVTIFGESAGAASCHYQMISPLTKGMFQRAILQSGTCLNPWILSMKGRERSFYLAEILGNKTEDPVEALEFLQSVSLEDLIKNQDSVLSSKDKASFPYPFVPTVEVPGTGNNFLIKHPRIALQEGDFADIPVINGLNSKEGLVVLYGVDHTDEYFKTLNNDFGRIFSPHIRIPKENLQDTLKKIKHYYAGEKDMNWETLNAYTDFVGDLIYYVVAHEYVQTHLEKAKSPLFLYNLTYEGSTPFLKTIISRKYPDHQIIPGVCHADDLTYLFCQNIPGVVPIKPESLDEKIATYFTKMWVAFAKTGNPNIPEVGTDWEGCKQNHICYLEISAKPEMKYSRIYEDRMSFWDSILNSSPK